MNKEELHKIAPILSKTKKDSGFSIPKNYFDTIEEIVFSEIKLDTVNSSDKNSFKVPDAYFNTVEDNVLGQLNLEKLNSNADIPTDYFETFEDRVFKKLKPVKKKIKIISFTKYFAPIAIAASIAIIFTLNLNSKPVTFESLATSDIEEFIDYGFIDIDTQTLASTFSDIEFETDELNYYLTNNEALDYLSDEDLETIIYEN